MPWDRNPRKNDKASIEVTGSIVRFGFGAPLLARPGGALIAGHTRLKAVALLPGLWKKTKPAERAMWSADARALATDDHPVVPVRFLDLSEAQARALALADNRISGEWDDDALAAILRDLDAAGEPLAGLGWSDDELKALIDGLDEDTDNPSGGGQQAMQGTYAVLITCTDERHQRSILEQLAEEGLECRAWNL